MISRVLLSFVSLGVWVYWLWPSSTWGQSSMDDACNTRSMSYRFQFQVQGTLGVKRAPVFNPQMLKMATRTSTSYCSLPEGVSEFQDGIHSTNDSWNILLQFHHSGLIPIARSSSSPEQQVDNRPAEQQQRGQQAEAPKKAQRTV